MSLNIDRDITRATSSRRTLVGGALATGFITMANGLARPLAAAQTEPRRGGTLRVAQENDISSFDPHYSVLGPDRDVLYQIYDTITQFDAELTPQPCLAESWETPDPLTYVFHLRRDVTFHDGTPWNAEALAFNIDRVRHAGDASPLAADFVQIEAVEVVDEYTARINLAEPMAALLAMLADRWGMMVSPTAAAELGDSFTTSPVGSGPFRFVAHVPGERIEVARNEQYWNASYPYLDGIVWSTVPDADARYTMLRDGQLDVTPWVAAKDIDEVKASPELGYVEMLSLGFEDVRFNCSKPPFDNLALRQACSLGIDRQAIVDEIFLGHAQVARGPLPPTTWAANLDLPFPARDVELARQKLAEAGYPDGVEVEWDCPAAGDEERRGRAMQAQLAEIGIDVKLLLMSNEEAKQREIDGTFQAELLYWSGRADPDMTMYSMFHTGGGYNTMRYSNDRVDELTRAARLTNDQPERKALYDEAQAIVVEEAPRLFVVHKVDVVAFQGNVHDVDYFPDTRTRYLRTWIEG